MSVETIRQEVQKFKQEKKRLFQELVQSLQRKYIRCVHCRNKSQVRFWTFIRDMWYKEPYGCTGGACWRNNKTETCHLVCPKCDKENYIFNHPEKEKIVELVDETGPRHIMPKKIFKEAVRREND